MKSLIVIALALTSVAAFSADKKEVKTVKITETKAVEAAVVPATTPVVATDAKATKKVTKKHTKKVTEVNAANVAPATTTTTTTTKK
ncbi:MAG: hypothetical protein H7336_13335 [Bacteriovorax sp.]|nr:hypothetical protein [Bacteriovorax sp.]